MEHIQTYQPGETVYDENATTTVQILEKLEAWGFVSYRVFNSATGKVYKVSPEQIRKDGGKQNYDESYLRYVTLLTKIKNETAGGMLSSLSNGVIPLPHQLHVLNRVMEHNTIRYILADEVGLGKTIEAGMVIKELKARGLVQRVLVVCPTGLVTQWSVELHEKFQEKFNVILPSDFDIIRRLTDNDDVYGQYNQVISPMDAIKPIDHHAGWTDEKVNLYNQERIYAIINSGWDLIIIDEAHRIAGSSSDVARYKLGTLLAHASPYLLLLSATPHNGKSEPFLRLIRLLDEAAFPNVKSIVKEQVSQYLIRTEKREAIDNYGNLLFKKRFTHLVEIPWDVRHTMQRELYELVTSYVSKTYNKAKRNRRKNMCLIFLLVIMQRMVVSSTAAIRQSLERRLEILKNQRTRIGTLTESDLAELDIEDNVEDALAAISLDVDDEIAELANIITVVKQAEFQNQDAKIETLQDTIDKILAEDAIQKIIVFTEFVATQTYLRDVLVRKGYMVSILNGGMTIEERNQALEDFRERTSIFISTDAGGEGLNLQFANIIINFDLPWNPMKIEQRCGRADRIGQKRDVHIYNFIISDTVENRVREVLEKKLSVILEEIGIDKYSDVLDSEIAECDFTDAYMNSISQPQKIDEAVRSVENELRQQMENTIQYKDVIREDKDLTELIGKESEFDVEEALPRLMTYYDAWQGNELTLQERIGINDSRFVRHLKNDIIQDRLSPLLSISIRNFPNEEGFFMLWEISLGDEASGKRIIPVFINSSFVLRPMAGSRIMEQLLNPQSRLTVHSVSNVDDNTYARLEKMSMDFAYNTFVKLKDAQLQRNKSSYDKYLYALQLRTEAAQQIGIENIRKARLARLSREKAAIEANYHKGQQMFPDFRLVLLVKLEA